MSIYTPFTYIIGWSEHKKFYYGAKCAQGCQPSDLWESYFTSSEYVTEFREENGEPDIIKIHRKFQCSEDCVSFEHEFLTKIDAKNHQLFLNKSNGSKSFISKGLVVVKDKEGKTFQISIDDPRYLSGELVYINVGKVVVKDKEGKTFQISIDDPRYISGELVSVTKGKVTVKDNDGNKFQVYKDDPRYLSRELVGVSKNLPINVGTVSVKDSSGSTFRVSTKDPRFISGELQHTSVGKKHSIITCPFCMKSGGIANMKRYHFDNCKYIK